MNQARRKYIVAVIISACFALLIMFGLRLVFSTDKVYFELNNVSELQLYKAPHGGNPNELNTTKKPDVLITKSGESSIKKGYYIYVAKPIQQDYATVTGSFYTKERKLNIELQYSNEKLQKLYSEELAGITESLNTKYPNQMKDYKIEYGKLYIDGTWFAGYLISRDGSDNLQVIAHKSSDSWKVVATPNITISKAQYSDIPPEVIDAVNVRPF